MRTRLLLCVFLAVLAADCRAGGVAPSAEELRVGPTLLDFGRVAVGASLTLHLELTNSAKRARRFSVEVPAPFWLEESSVVVAGGDTARILVTFRPTSQGDASGEVIAWENDVRVVVSARGEGLPQCEASACRAAVFDLTTRTCIEKNLPDGEPCAAECLAEAQCHAGHCVGTAKSCDDQDECTVDSCVPGVGCTWAPRACPIESACLVSSCDRRRGCVGEPVEDGAPCGKQRCATASLCLNGRCEERARPGAELHCRHSAVSAGVDSSCALTLAGDLKCWGGLPGAFMSRPVIVSPRADSACVPSGDATVYCGLGDGEVTERPLQLVVGIVFDPNGNPSQEACALFDGGLLKCSSGGADLTPPSGRYVDVAWRGLGDGVPPTAGLVALQVDGGLFRFGLRSGRWSQVDAGVAFRRLGKFRNSVVAFDESGGTLVLGSGGWPFSDAGTDVIGGHSDEACAVLVDGGVTCVDSSGQKRSIRFPVPPTSIAAGWMHTCAISGEEVWCWGRNWRGALGDFSRQLEQPTEVDAGFVSWLKDAGPSNDLGRPCWLESDGGVRCRALRSGGVGFFGAWVHVPLPEPAISVSSSCAVLASGTPRCWKYEQHLVNDGGVEYLARVEAIPGLHPVVRKITGLAESGCALYANNGVQCWGENFYGELGRPGPASVTAISVPVGEKLTDLVSSDDVSGHDFLAGRQMRTVCVKGTSGRAWCWGQSPGPLVNSSNDPIRADL